MENENTNYGVLIFFFQEKINTYFIFYSKKMFFEKINILFYFRVKIILYFIFRFLFNVDLFNVDQWTIRLDEQKIRYKIIILSFYIFLKRMWNKNITYI